MDSIRVTIQYTAEDLQSAYALHLKKTNPFRSRIILILGGIIVLLGCLLITLQIITRSVNWVSWLFLVYGAIIIFYYFWKLNRMGKTALKKLVEFHYPFTFTITDEGIQTTGKNVSSENKWEHYQSAFIVPQMIILYPNKLRFVLFPKKYFTDQEFAQLTEWVNEKVR